MIRSFLSLEKECRDVCRACQPGISEMHGSENQSGFPTGFLARTDRQGGVPSKLLVKTIPERASHATCK